MREHEPGKISSDLFAHIASFLPGEMVATGWLSARKYFPELEQVRATATTLCFKDLVGGSSILTRSKQDISLRFRLPLPTRPCLLRDFLRKSRQTSSAARPWWHSRSTARASPRRTYRAAGNWRTQRRLPSRDTARASPRWTWRADET